MAYKVGDKIRLIEPMQIDRWEGLTKGMIFTVEEVRTSGVKSRGHIFINDQIELFESCGKYNLDPHSQYNSLVTIPLFEYENLINCKEELDNLYEHDMIKEID